MNCLTEALGLSLPGNGSVLATHADRKGLFVEAGHLIVDLARRYYEQDDDSVLPRKIANFKAFENAMSMDIAMGGSTNTVLHLLAAAHEGEIPFTMADIDRLSRKVPVPVQGRAGSGRRPYGGRASRRRRDGDPGRAGARQSAAHGAAERAFGLAQCGAGALGHQAHLERKREGLLHGRARRRADPGRVQPGPPLSRSSISIAKTACVRDLEHAYSKDGGLGVLYGNIALDGCIVKTAGVDASILKFAGPARVFESQDAAVEAILTNKIKAGDIVVIIYEGPRGGPGMQEMLYPTSYLKSKGLGKACALITDGRFSGGTSGLSIGHSRRKPPKAA